MTSLFRVSSQFLLAAFFVASGASFSWAQLDPEKVLVGTWEGTVALPRDNGRTIIIRSVKPSETGWVAEGFYATSASKGKGARMTFEVSRQGDDIILEFVTSQKNPGKLKLVNERRLEGTMNFVTGGRSTNRDLILDKTEPKKE